MGHVSILPSSTESVALHGFFSTSTSAINALNGDWRLVVYLLASTFLDVASLYYNLI